MNYQMTAGDLPHPLVGPTRALGDRLPLIERRHDAIFRLRVEVLLGDDRRFAPVSRQRALSETSEVTPIDAGPIANSLK